jgi:glycosyltransferase involved in cell wall biosynthesis
MDAPMDFPDVTVSVAIPAYNAAATLNETVLSVRRQTHSNLEIFIVDDGSKDNTAFLAQAHAGADPRVTVIRKANGGVSSARNAALARATGAFFASVDADDLWHPEKIARQLEVMEKGGPDVLLSYTWFFYIDENNRILSTAEPSEDGDVIERMCRGNLVGNASSPLMRTAPLRSIGGWDEELRKGNEDYNTYFRLAEIGRFAVVRDYMLGYRQIPGNMSSNAAKMLASYDQVVARFAFRHPEHAAQLAAGRSNLIAYLFDKALLNLAWRAALFLFWQALVSDKVGARRLLLNAPLVASRIILPLSVRARLQRAVTNVPMKGELYPPGR